jgi:hypothetical protein
MAAWLKIPLQFVVPVGFPVQVPGVPVYATSFWLRATNPMALPRTLINGALPLIVESSS